MYQVILTTLFGIESVAAQEILELGYKKEQLTVSDGLLILNTGEKWSDLVAAVARLNIHVATAERVLVQIAMYKATTYDQLFDQTRSLPWEEWLPEKYAIIVNGYARNSQLYGIRSCQSLIKKAVVARLLAKKGRNPDSHWPEDRMAGQVKIQFSIVSDMVRLMIDTSGEGLHKRGYRPLRHEAPLRETLAAAIIRLARFNPWTSESLWDPMCGSGTIPIEAALIAANIPPGLNRRFIAETLPVIGQSAFMSAREMARQRLTDAPADQPFIVGSDIAADSVEIAEQNARQAGVAELITFFQADVTKTDPDLIRRKTDCPQQLVICNPPYGERMEDHKTAQRIQSALGQTFFSHGFPLRDTRFYLLSPLTGFEDSVGRSADKRRKLYNGMIPCTLYQYFRQRRTDK